MDFERANQYADQIARTGDRELHKDLVSMCIPYIFKLRKEWRWFHISPAEIKDELAADAVSDAIMSDRPERFFVYRLNASFKKLGRQKTRAMNNRNRKHLERLIEKCQKRGSSLVQFNAHMPPPESEILKREEKLLVLHALKDHPEFSKKVVFQRFRGLYFTEMANIYNKTFNECKRVFCHDFYHIKKKLYRIHKGAKI